MDISDHLGQGERVTRKARQLRTMIIVFIPLFTLQFWLGMSINLEINLPVEHFSAVESVIYFSSHFPMILAHILTGSLIVILATVFLAVSLTSSTRSFAIIGIIGMSAVIGATVNGILFLMTGQFFGNSIGMAMSAVVALITYLTVLYKTGLILGRKQLASRLQTSD